jgi:hypothetical protein
MKFWPALVYVFLFLLTFAAATPARADFSQALSDYNFRYSSYRTAYSKFQVAKSTYQTYRTLTAQNAAVAAFRDVLTSRNTLVSSYFDLLQEKLNNTPAIDSVDLQTYTGIRKSTKDWLSANQIKTNGAATLGDLNTASKDFENRYPQMSTDMRQAIGHILIAKGTFLNNRLQIMFDQMETVSRLLSQGGENPSNVDRGLIQAKIKRDLFTDKQNALKTHFFSQDSYYSADRSQILPGQQLAVEANQYLKESVSYLLEIVKDLTGE